MSKSPSKIGVKSASRGADGRFSPGSPGGPGRREGSRNRASVLLDELAEGRAAEILEKVIRAALSGDLDACELVLRRIWPAPKGRRVALEGLPMVREPADVVVALARLLEAVSTGEIEPETGQLLAALVEAQRKSIELVELERRLAALEEGIKA